MVRCTPGPLVTSASGRIGGVVMTTKGGGVTGSAWSARCWRMSAEQQDVRQLMGLAAMAWHGLDAAQRAVWSAIGANVPRRLRSGLVMPLSGYQAHARAWLAQVGLGTAVAPVNLLLQPGLITPALELEVLEGAVTCVAVDREIGEKGTLCLRVGEVTRPTLARLSRNLLRYVQVSPTGRLDLYDARGEWRDAAANWIELPFATALSGAATLAVWCKLGTMQPGSTQRAVYRCVAPPILVWRTATGWRAVWGANDQSVVATPSESAWHLIVHTLSAPGGRYRLWVDGSMVIDAAAVAWTLTTGRFDLGSWGAYGDGMYGRFAWFQVSNVARDAAWVANVWDAGAGRPMPMDGNVTDQWRLAERSGAGWVNDVAGRLVGSRNGCQQVANPWGAVCWASGENRFGAGARGRIMAQWRPSELFPPTPSETVYTFVA